VGVLASYLTGRWQAPGAGGAVIRDAVTGEQIIQVSATGLDLDAAMTYARRTGGPGLRSLTFHQRADLLGRLAEHIRSERDRLYELSLRTGATLSDSKFDVDGGIRVLRYYAARGRSELPDSPVLFEGDPEELSSGGKFVGQHLYSPAAGVAIQINAFNFPVWAPLEKLATALLAGVPSLIKPATPTAYLTALLVEIIVAANVLPPGAVQLWCGSGSHLLDLATEQDMISFTGSADTALRLRSHPNVATRSVRFNVEADSVNSTILGPDVSPDSALMAGFVDQVVTEMTVKAGQKCTAIRRIFVPAVRVEAVARLLSEKLASVVVGNPRSATVRMGALASLEQRAEVRRAISRIASSGTIVFGDPDRADPVDADPDRGAFMSPVLLRCDDGAAAAHDTEPFGPVATLIGYHSESGLIDLCNRGRGSLVASLASEDSRFIQTVVLGIAPWHGRILLLNEEDAAESTGHGSPLPALTHGGPGRAGGGSEMGGLRGVLRHMQCTAIQAGPETLSRLDTHRNQA